MMLKSKLSLFWTSALIAVSMGVKPTPALALEWHDGDKTLKLWPQKNLVAEFSERPILSRSFRVKSMKEQGKTRILNLGSEKAAVQSLRKARSGETPQANYSEVFADDREGGHLRALPGNVIVQFEETLSEADIEKWVKTRDLKIVEKLGFQPNTYLIASQPGLASLELANRLYGQEGVLQSSPNWWIEMSLR